jgi:glycine betaine/proline transport system substrate-binding protein
VKPFTDDKTVEDLAQNLEGAGYGLVVPDYVADAGVKSLEDIGKSRTSSPARSTASSRAMTATASCSG